MKDSLYSCLLIARLPSGSRTLNWQPPIELCTWFCCYCLLRTCMLLFEYGEPFYGLSWRQSSGNLLLIYWACRTLHDVMHKCTHWIASFPGPTQLSVACSMVKRGKPGIFSYVRVWRNQKIAKITGSVLHIFNRLHAQCSVCTTVAPRLLDTYGKLPGTLTVFGCSGTSALMHN